MLLPTRYNDGEPVKAERIDLVPEEVSDCFGGTSFHSEHLRGVWVHQAQRRLALGSPDLNSARLF